MNIKAVEQLIKMGYELTINQSGDIDCKQVGTTPVDESKVIPLLEQIKKNRLQAVQYIQTIIKVVVSVKEGLESGMYQYDTFDSSGQLVTRYSLKTVSQATAAGYMNENYIDNPQYTTIAAFFRSSSGEFRYYGSDQELFQRQKIFAEASASEAAACPWK